ncbi:hypothetical protein BKA70DRAFT_1237516 [Coprinopsis sp. MPI-PUGE-AT-0042]|nr:hypothetical protein BKA70DRAFT_1237516 [Coprinopsis sp. MPI-PUGE-AT-0042]
MCPWNDEFRVLRRPSIQAPQNTLTLLAKLASILVTSHLHSPSLNCSLPRNLCRSDSSNVYGKPHLFLFLSPFVIFWVPSLRVKFQSGIEGRKAWFQAARTSVLARSKYNAHSPLNPNPIHEK